MFACVQQGSCRTLQNKLVGDGQVQSVLHELTELPVFDEEHDSPLCP